MRYLLTLEYDGAAYAGWQRQKNAVTVQEKVETALQTLLGVKTVVYASGRTDAGVHAAGQAAHFDSERVLDKERYGQRIFIQHGQSDGWLRRGGG